MDGGIYSTGNAIVDENAKLNISGNVIPQMWYRTIVRESGKPNLTAIIILADIVYWYKPTELRDESSGQVVAVKKKFKADLLQRSYQQISEQFGISKKEATNAIIFLEKLGVVKRVFRTVNINGLVVNNVLYLELIVQKLRQLTYPQDSHNCPLSFERERGDTKREDISPKEGTGGEIRTCEMGAVPLKSERVSPFEETPATLEDMEVPLLENTAHFFEGGTNTEITQETTTETSPEITTEINVKEYTNPIISYQAAEKLFKLQIDYDAIWMDRPYDRKLLNEIVAIAVDVLTSKARTVRINREDKPTPVVQGIYKKIEKSAVEFVMDSIQNCGSKAINIRAVIMTSLYNAVMTTTSYFTNLYAYHSANPQISLRTYKRIEYGQQKPNVHVVIRLQKLFQKDIDILIKEIGE